jgi:hypothetical protein
VRLVMHVLNRSRHATARPNHGSEPSSRHVDELLDERLTHCGRAREFAKLVETYGAGK